MKQSLLLARTISLLSLPLIMVPTPGCAMDHSTPKTDGRGQTITTFLMFEGKAEEAIKFYISSFKNSRILEISRYGAAGPGKEGTVRHAVFSLDGHVFMAIDSPVKHEFTFTSAISLYVKCKTDSEINELFKKLSDGGKVFMPLDKYPFSEKFGWVADRFGVSWQLDLSN